MASLFRPTRPYPVPSNATVVSHNGKPHIRTTENGRSVMYPLSKDGTKYLKPLKKWYGQYTDSNGTVRRVPLSSNRTAAQQLLADLVRKRERSVAQLDDPFEAHSALPLTQHLDDWRRALLAEGASTKHVQQTIRCVSKLLRAIRATRICDLSASRLQESIAALRSNSRNLPPIDSTKECFTRDEVADAIGVTPLAIPSLIRRHRLKAVGKGKSRRYPKETVEALLTSRNRGLSIRTSNQYLVAIKAFAAWLIRDRRARENPLVHLEVGNVRVDRRHDRRPLSADELRSLIRTASDSSFVFRGITGRDRVAIYAIAGSTGFRAEELYSARSRMTRRIMYVRL